MYKRPINRAELPEALPYRDSTAILSTPCRTAGHTLPNRIVYQPMEGCDGTGDGTPGELTVRRYCRFAHGGPGLIWFEATAILPQARANPRQMMLTEKNRDAYKRLLSEMREISVRENGYAPLIICQLTHSGRYSKPNGYPEPLVAQHRPLFEGDRPLSEDRILTDDDLAALPERYAHVARLAAEVGFDGVDIKACHGYLLSELLGAYGRSGPFGGEAYENRTRLLLSAVEAVRAAAPDSLLLASRFNAYDGFPYPHGFAASDRAGVPDLREPERLAGDLVTRGVRILDVTMGNPYQNHEVNRPTAFADAVPPYESILRMRAGAIAVANAARAVAADALTVSSGSTFLGVTAPHVAAADIDAGAYELVGFGRQSFADPDSAQEILRDGCADPRRLCLTCGKCTALMRAGKTPGCVIYDKDIYGSLYRETFAKQNGGSKV